MHYRDYGKVCNEGDEDNKNDAETKTKWIKMIMIFMKIQRKDVHNDDVKDNENAGNNEDDNAKTDNNYNGNEKYW